MKFEFSRPKSSVCGLFLFLYGSSTGLLSVLEFVCLTEEYCEEAMAPRDSDSA